LIECDRYDAIKDQCPDDRDIPGLFILKSGIEEESKKAIFDDGIAGPKIEHIGFADSGDNRRGHFSQDGKDTRQKYYP
jgi:hypothetical protein